MKINAAIDILSQNEKAMIHDKSLSLLEKTGIKAPYKPFLTLLESYGACVDYQTEIVKFPRLLLEDMLNKKKSQSTGELTVSKIKGSISTQVFIVDYRSRTRRYGQMIDLIKGIALLNQLENFTNADAIVVPSDVPHTVSDILSFLKLFTFSKKHGASYILTPMTAACICDMAKVMDRSLYYSFQTVSPLQFTRDTLEIAMVFHEKGMPAGAGPFVMSMGSGPVTIAGSLLLQNAEQLACMFCNQALGGYTSGYHASIHPLDLSTLICSFGSPNLAVSTMAGCSMARFYGLHPGSNTGLTDSLQPDFQCGFEKGMTAAFAAFSGNLDIGCQGIVGADQGISLEQLVIDNEWISAFNDAVSGFEINEETLAEQLIYETGIGGSFIDTDHTVEHMKRSYWVSKIFSRQTWDAKELMNGSDLLDKAYQQVEQMTINYEKMEPVISMHLKSELEGIAAEGLTKTGIAMKLGPLI